MSHDIVADALNQIMNAKRAGHASVQVKHSSKFLVSVLALAKLRGYIADYKSSGREMLIEIGAKLNKCNAIKPRYLIKASDITKYVRRYLPSRDMGVLIISTNQGLLAHHTAIQKNLGGSVIAYFY